MAAQEPGRASDLSRKRRFPSYDDDTPEQMQVSCVNLRGTLNPIIAIQ